MDKWEAEVHFRDHARDVEASHVAHAAAGGAVEVWADGVEAVRRAGLEGGGEREGEGQGGEEEGEGEGEQGRDVHC